MNNKIKKEMQLAAATLSNNRLQKYAKFTISVTFSGHLIQRDNHM